MRIIAGLWRGRPLAAPDGMATRPTADRVRETLFSMLTSRLGSFQDLRVADLFAGSGALGFEALSRGAAEAVFVEREPTAIAAIRVNAAKLNAEAKIRIVSGSALHPQPAEPFDLVFADPPYSPGSGTESVAAIETAGWLSSGGWMSVETARGDVVRPSQFVIDAERDVGRARLTLLRCP